MCVRACSGGASCPRHHACRATHPVSIPTFSQASTPASPPTARSWPRPSWSSSPSSSSSSSSSRELSGRRTGWRIVGRGRARLCPGFFIEGLINHTIKRNAKGRYLCRRQNATRGFLHSFQLCYGAVCDRENAVGERSRCVGWHGPTKTHDQSHDPPTKQTRENRPSPATDAAAGKEKASITVSTNALGFLVGRLGLRSLRRRRRSGAAAAA